ncbi:uncharacterized protein LOC128867268 [Anastrepha ludens]|uniref:uncharacterized protein LOC128867268 n=1 Tax=Anastrepha ludens TaxID=28586 RepID=UPI0023B009A8|nr:uncharacterized protein LOC128867268 [Anastrepha ludens]
MEIEPEIQASTSRGLVTPWEISPPPKLRDPPPNRKGRKTKATVLTTSPYKCNLLQSIESINRKRNAPVNPSPKPSNKKNISTKSFVDSHSSDSEEEFPDVPPTKESAANKTNYCGKIYGQDIIMKPWTSCLQCEQIWAHEKCIPNRSAIFLCDSLWQMEVVVDDGGCGCDCGSVVAGKQSVQQQQQRQ